MEVAVCVEVEEEPEPPGSMLSAALAIGSGDSGVKGEEEGRPPHGPGKRLLRVESALEGVSRERLQERAIASPSTLVCKAFSARAGLEPWPLEAKKVSAFIRFLGIEAKYGIDSIENVIVPSLKRVQVEKMGVTVSVECANYMTQALKDVKNSKCQLKTGEGREPSRMLSASLSARRMGCERRLRRQAYG